MNVTMNEALTNGADAVDSMIGEYAWWMTSLPGFFVDVALVTLNNGAISLSRLGLNNVVIQPFTNKLKLTNSTMLKSRNGAAQALLYTMKIPNIEGIPINCDSLQSNKQVEASEQIVLQQERGTYDVSSLAGTQTAKQARIDNVVPRLKTWTLHGWLKSDALPFLLVMEGITGNKLGLQFQVRYLEALQNSRQPVWFKDNMGMYYQVLMLDLQTVYKAEHVDGVEVTITLKEYKPYVVGTHFGVDITSVIKKVV